MGLNSRASNGSQPGGPSRLIYGLYFIYLGANPGADPLKYFSLKFNSTLKSANPSGHETLLTGQFQCKVLLFWNFDHRIRSRVSLFRSAGRTSFWNGAQLSFFGGTNLLKRRNRNKNWVFIAKICFGRSRGQFFVCFASTSPTPPTTSTRKKKC